MLCEQNPVSNPEKNYYDLLNAKIHLYFFIHQNIRLMLSNIIKIALLCLFFIGLNNSILAHKPSETYTNIQQTEKHTMVRIEFTWTIQDAIKTAFS